MASRQTLEYYEAEIERQKAHNELQRRTIEEERGARKRAQRQVETLCRRIRDAIHIIQNGDEEVFVENTIETLDPKGAIRAGIGI